MTARHYDVVVLGRSLGALTAAALLARREFRVLVLGQGERPPNYQFGRHLLRRRLFTFLCGHSPIWRKVLQDLAQSQNFNRRLHALDPMFALLTGKRRLELSPDVVAFGREIDREFPEVRQLVDEFHSRLAIINAAIDAALERDVAWPPATLLERWQTGRAIADIPLASGETANQLLEKFPQGHPYRDVALIPALFASDLDPSRPLTSLSLARLHGSWIRGLLALPDEQPDLEGFLVERIAAHGGECRLSASASRIAVERGRANEVWIDGEENAVGTQAVISAGSGASVAELAHGEGLSSRMLSLWPRLSASGGRFVCNVVLNSAGLPEQLCREAFLLPPEGSLGDSARPCLHVQKFSPAPDETLLVAELPLRAEGGLPVREARAHVLSLLRFHFPFLDEHLIAVDSPHDGLPANDYSNGNRVDVERFHLTHGGAGGEPMEPLWRVDPPGFLELGGEPLRGPIRGTYLVGKTVLPGLGQEGELAAAWSVARLLTKKDAVRQRRRRQMWTKIETG